MASAPGSNHLVLVSEFTDERVKITQMYIPALH